MLKLFKYFKKQDWLFAIVSFIFIIAQVWLDLRLPDYMSEITQLVQTTGHTVGEVFLAGGNMLLCALGSMVCTAIVSLFVAKIAAGLSKNLRAQIYEKTMSFSMEEIGGFSTASLITRTTNDVTQIQTFVAMGLQVMVKAPILAVWAMCKIYGRSWQWTTVTVIALALLVIVIGLVMGLCMSKFRKMQVLTDNLNRVSRENLIGIRVVRAYNAEKYQEEKFEQANDELTKTTIFTQRWMVLMAPGMSLIMSWLTLSIYVIGAFLIESASATNKLTVFSDMVVFSSYAMQIIMAFMLLTMVFVILPRASVAAKRINEVLETTPKIVDGVIEDKSSQRPGEVEFKNVSFRYPGAAEDVLHNISFSVSKGQTVAFIGSTGSGKSTLINLIPRFYDATQGEVLIDGTNVKSYRQSSLRKKIGYVSQKAVLFSGSVKSNVTYGSDTQDQEEIAHAVNIASAEEFVSQMDGIYDAAIAQDGTNLSGGQKQRLSIARAVYRKPEIYIFDDSFSALDYKTDHQVREALKRETAGVTTIIVAQRVGTIMDADQIIVLDEGTIIGHGKHKDLLQTCSVYRQIAESQLAKEEL